MTPRTSDSQTGTLAHLVVRFGHLLMELVAGEDTRVRSVIANAAIVNQLHDQTHSGMRRCGDHRDNY